ncbi:MAG: HAMP domain-containing sensor histidine kinase [Bacteroidetes bacterium]|jgi:signal transduction histidine kinase|nr:HAMP domain-containing sensor histidine kinase [Bacteroidota bacterium]|tara:strand:- start:579 stop:1520 length:942 start_codon:yes stop_codon:yes gene_type:complete
MGMKRFGAKQRIWLTAFLGGYILLQFSWWAWLLVSLQAENIAIAQGEAPQLRARSTEMILGEGLVFLLLLALGFRVIWKGLQRDRERARRERHFLLAVTHELKTPIAAVRLALDTLQKHRVDAETSEELLNEAQIGTQRLEQRVENILQSNRLVFGKNLSSEAYDAEEIIAEAVRRHRIGPFRHREINIAHEGNAHGLLQGDSDALLLAWGNLIENGLKYSPDSAFLDIRLQWKDDALLCQFDDGGMGIPPSMRKHVLEQFKRVEHPGQKDIEGTGLGLYLAHQIIRMHRGRLTIESSQRGGCLITTTIPFNP